MTTATAQALHVGQVLQGSWGYDMTINEFFVIQRLTASSVWLREVAAVVSNDNCMGNGRAIPDPFLKPVGPVIRRKVKAGGNYGPYVTLNSCCTLSPLEWPSRLSQHLRLMGVYFLEFKSPGQPWRRHDGQPATSEASAWLMLAAWERYSPSQRWRFVHPIPSHQ